MSQHLQADTHWALRSKCARLTWREFAKYIPEARSDNDNRRLIGRSDFGVARSIYLRGDYGKRPRHAAAITWCVLAFNEELGSETSLQSTTMPDEVDAPHPCSEPNLLLGVYRLDNL